jgi:hypothetical protein
MVPQSTALHQTLLTAPIVLDNPWWHCIPRHLKNIVLLQIDAEYVIEVGKYSDKRVRRSQ